MADEYAFGPFRFDAADRLLTRDGDPVRLTPRAADVLLALLRHEGHVVTKEEFIRDVWGGAFVEDGTLTFHVHLVRQALKYGAGGQQYIETIPKRGYRFIARAQPVCPLPPAEPTSLPLAAGDRIPVGRWPIRGGLALLATVVSILVWMESVALLDRTSP